MRPEDYEFSVTMETRDYECDAQGIVNNANYQHYLEVARHKWILQKGTSFAELHERGVDFIVAEINIKYLTPLHGQEEFICCLNFKRESPRFIFEQEIFRKSDSKPVARARVISACLVNGVLTRGDEVSELL